ncbi:ion transporter [Pseudovibrio sp. POLY-S9]|uniref:ion transporter n=1 Tax=Pseudovibrio sp. POLY-S9 TaxID=1576596 RepID=UPI000710D4E2|nr:ion transporter [Pseudovibrio sp. POLY-S9]
MSGHVDDAKKLRAIIESKAWEYTIISIIALNAITLGVETSQTVQQHYGPILRTLDDIVVGIYVIEISLRVFAYGFRFFRGAWNLFDFFIVSIALIPATGPAAILRSLRILRVLRLISVVPSLRRVIGGLVLALPGMGSIMLLLSLVYYVFSVMATQLYGETFPEWFGTIGASAYSLFQIMTLEGWSDAIVRPVMDVYPNAWLFFIPFILTTALTVLNLFIGVIVAAMEEEHERDVEEHHHYVRMEANAIMKELRTLRQDVTKLRRNRKAPHKKTAELT